MLKLLKGGGQAGGLGSDNDVLGRRGGFGKLGGDGSEAALDQIAVDGALGGFGANDEAETIL